LGVTCNGVICAFGEHAHAVLASPAAIARAAPPATILDLRDVIERTPRIGCENTIVTTRSEVFLKFRRIVRDPSAGCIVTAIAAAAT